MTDRISEITEQVKKAMQKQEELDELAKKVDQLRQQLTAKESAGTNVGVLAGRNRLIKLHNGE